MQGPATIVMGPPRDAADLEAIRTLFRAYAESLGFSLAYQRFEEELAGLPGKYAPPDGTLLLARADEQAAGTVALRRLETDICEMKRLYVAPAFRGLRTREGLSIGRALAYRVVDEARALGYRRLRLDTISDRMTAAVGLYRSMGFVAIPPYYPSPIPGTAFMELAL
ncbi:MAG: GNAT family N-acetyltransferase [Pseudomonadota bacterium]